MTVRGRVSIYILAIWSRTSGDEKALLPCVALRKAICHSRWKGYPLVMFLHSCGFYAEFFSLLKQCWFNPLPCLNSLSVCQEAPWLNVSVFVSSANWAICMGWAGSFQTCYRTNKWMFLKIGHLLVFWQNLCIQKWIVLCTQCDELQRDNSRN